MSQSQTASPLEYRVGDQPVPGYTLIRELGRGAMGVVWLAQTESGFERALKVINLTQRGGKKEYRGLRTIKQRKLLHGNLLTLIDYWLKDDDGKFIQDSDQLDATDSFFATPSDQEPRPGSMAATTPHSLGTTETGRNSADSGSAAGSTKPEVHRAVTRVASATIVSTEPDPPPVDKLGSTTDYGGEKLAMPSRRPVQLIVAMELGHKTLDDRQKQLLEDRTTGIPADELLPYMEQAARGLDYLHREGIVHRDIKPQNIMLVGDVAKVCDYGLVVTTDADLRATSNAFTPLYASPEAVGDKPVTGQSDQYSLAVTYIELRTGHTPYSSETAASVYAAKETGKYDLSRIRNTTVRKVLSRALNRSPNERFGSCSQFIRELEKAENVSSGKTWLAVAAAAIALVLLGGAVAVPQVRERLLAIVQPDHGENKVNKKDSDSSSKNTDKIGREEPVAPPLPPPPREMRKVVDEARELRLAGKSDEAAAKLDELKVGPGDSDPTHWPYHLERLHLDISRHADSPSAVSSSQWEAWRQAAEQLMPRARGQAAEQVELAALETFIATRLDAASIALEMPLADEFARLSSGKDHWKKVLSPAEQSRLQSLYDALKQRMVVSREPLPPAWKRRFGEIWPAPSGAQLLIDRARRGIADGNSAGLVAAVADIGDLEGQVSIGLAPGTKSQLDAVRLEIKQSQNKLLIDSLARRLTNDDFLANADARKELLDQIRSIGDTSDLALAALLRIEAEMADMDSAEKRYSPELVDELSELTTRLSGASEPPLSDWRDYGRFLLARTENGSPSSGSSAPQNSPQVEVLLNWPESATVDWHTPRRKEQAIALLLRLVDASQPLAAKDAVRFQELQRELAPQATAAATYLDKARRLGCDSAYCHGLSAVALALMARQPDAAAWLPVAEAADRALAGWSSVTNVGEQSHKAAIEYVSAVAASRVRDASAVGRNRAAIGTLASLLKQTFRDDGLRNVNLDRAMLENIVLPALQVPAQDSSDVAADLASLWAAKGRLIERNPTAVFLSLEGVNPAENTDDYARAMLTAHEAYARALALDDTVTSAAGAARTLLKLPRELFNWQKYESELARLVERHRQASGEDPSLLFADACVLRRRAFMAADQAQKLQMADQALDRFTKVGVATRSADPYAIRGVSLCAASDTYLKVAFWTPIAASDESKTSAGNPTKFSLLTKALDAASAAATDLNLPLPEEARTARGNALEDLALYYKETDNYQRAASAFQEALDQIGRRRSKAYALMSLGRCQYRWAMDAARIDVNPQERVTRLREAFVSLSDALAHARDRDAGVVPEASFWHATVIWESALEGPGDLATPSDANRAAFRNASLGDLARGLADPTRKEEVVKEITARLNQMEAARKEIVSAAQEARTHSIAEWAQYVPTAASLGKTEYDSVRALSSSVSVAIAPTAILDEVRQELEELLALAKRESNAIAPRERRNLINLMVRVQMALPGSTPQKVGQLLPEYEKLLAGNSDRERAELVYLRLSASNYVNATDFSAEEKLASQITNPRLANWALGNCEKFKADALLKPYLDRLRAYLGDPVTSKSLTVADDAKLQAVQNEYAAALDGLIKSSDPKTISNFGSLCATPLAEIDSGRWQQNLSKLEADELRRNVEESEAIRWRLYDVLLARVFLHRDKWQLYDAKKPLPDDFRQVIRLTIDCLKPLRFRDVRFAGNKLKSEDLDLLRTCETRLEKSAN